MLTATVALAAAAHSNSRWQGRQKLEEESSERRRHETKLQDPRRRAGNIGALKIRIGFWGILYHSHNKEPQNSIGNYSGPCISRAIAWRWRKQGCPARSRSSRLCRARKSAAAAESAEAEMWTEHRKEVAGASRGSCESFGGGRG